MIDWEAAKLRLTELGAKLGPSPEREGAVMAARAALLARAPPVAEAGETLDLVGFGCGGERFALKSHFVRATERLPKLTAVPFGPAALLGLCAFRGQLLSVWDPAGLLIGAAAGLTPAWLLVLGRGHDELGLAVQEVSFSQGTRGAAVLPTPEGLSAPQRSHLFEGLIGSESVRLLSGPAILAAPELSWS